MSDEPKVLNLMEALKRSIEEKRARDAAESPAPHSHARLLGPAVDLRQLRIASPRGIASVEDGTARISLALEDGRTAWLAFDGRDEMLAFFRAVLERDYQHRAARGLPPEKPIGGA